MDGGYARSLGVDPSLRRDVADVRTAVLTARGDEGRVLLEGVHALKHAIRFDADVEVVVTPDLVALAGLFADLAPDLAVPAHTVEVDRTTWGTLVARELPSPVLAIARRPRVAADDVLAAPGRIVVLEGPRHLGNVGAVIRVAAAAGAGGVLDGLTPGRSRWLRPWRSARATARSAG